ncbi:pirin family protein [Burkholderia cepacia]|uniref:pirin family protein n=1 Tax=Burkholderia cepacia TaxID=292 RepID=UPI002AB6FB7E|nr:pirin family protein [Burkholderia cepacia]
MAVHVSGVVESQMSSRGAVFSAKRIDLQALGPFADPVVGLDHFRMNAPTFAPHPHAGFSAITYIFEDSRGAVRNRDSLGHDFVAEPGDIIWTQAGSGVVHDEFPVKSGHEVHGIQLFVNLSAANKQLDPKVLWVKRDDIPEIGDAGANRLRVVAGEYAEKRSPLVPAEPFLLLDGVWSLPGDLLLHPDWNTLIYVLEGSLRLDWGGGAAHLRYGQTLGMRSDDRASVQLTPDSTAHVLVLAGPALKAPVVVHGPFIMNSTEQLADAVARFNSGKMGRLQPVGVAPHEGRT